MDEQNKKMGMGIFQILQKLRADVSIEASYQTFGRVCASRTPVSRQILQIEGQPPVQVSVFISS